MLTSLVGLQHALAIVLEARKLDFLTHSVGGLGHLCVMRYKGHADDRTGSSFDKSRRRAILKAHSEMVEREIVRPLIASNANAAVGSAAYYDKRGAYSRALCELYERDALVNSWAAKATDGEISPPATLCKLLSDQGLDVIFYRLAALSGGAILCVITELETGNTFQGAAHTVDIGAEPPAETLEHAFHEAFMMCVARRLRPDYKKQYRCEAPAYPSSAFGWLKNRRGKRPNSSVNVRITETCIRNPPHTICLTYSPDLSGLMSNHCVRVVTDAVHRLHPGSSIDLTGPIPVLAQSGNMAVTVE
jgi:hypothetical protein